MFWVIFDTSTKLAYYRDVHNLLALPPGSTIRYDYNQNHLSKAAIEEGKRNVLSAKKVLVAYAQHRNFKKGADVPVGPIAYEEGLWAGTRIANLSRLQFSVNRYFFDLEMLEYPSADNAAFDTIMRALVAARDTPFEKWVAVSNLDDQFDALTRGTAADNWTSVINRIGNAPSQFAGDSFWRIANVASGPQRSNIEPLVVSVEPGDKDAIGQVDAVFPVYELDQIALQIESRTPEAIEGSHAGEAHTEGMVTFETVAPGPLEGLNGKTLMLRRYATNWIEAEVRGSDRILAQLSDLKMNTGIAADKYPLGPNFQLRFRVAKKPERVFLAVLLAILAAGSGIAATSLKDQVAWGIVLGTLGVVLVGVAYFLWSGRVNLPGAK